MNQPSTAAVLVSPERLAADLADYVVVDVRWYLDGRSGRDAYRAGHLPGARFVDLDDALTMPGPKVAGRHPLPDPEHFAKALSEVGIGDDDHVVAYDDTGGGCAGRLVWMLRSIGQAASLLDGGIGAWSGEIEQGEPVFVPGERVSQPWPSELLIDITDLDHLAADDVLLDARSPERYRGEVEPVDPRAGHIPFAKNLPWTTLLGDDGRFLPPDQLRARFAEVGIDTADHLVASCGSGVTACALLLGAEQAGIGFGRLFVPSFSGWSSSSRPVATGS